MRQYHKYQRRVYFPLLFLGLSAFSLCLIPLSLKVQSGASGPMTILIAAIFWAGLIIGILLSIQNAGRLQALARRKGVKDRRVRNLRPGLLNFSVRDKKSVILYAVIAVGLLTAILDIITDIIPGNIMYPILSITLFAIELHSIMDGKSTEILRILQLNAEDKNHDGNE